MIRHLDSSLRSLLRSPISSGLIVLTLALGMGATTTIYSVVRGVLLQPLPFPDQDRLAMLWQRAPGVGIDEDWFSPTQFFDLAERVPSFERVGVAFGLHRTLTDGDTPPQRLGVLQASSSLLDLLGVGVVAGRGFGEADDRPSAEPKILLSHRLFEGRFGADPEIVGSTLRLDGRDIEVIGVLPPGLILDADLIPTLFTVPTYDLVESLPLANPGRTTHGAENYNVLARLAPDASPSRVEAELLQVAEHFRRDPDSLAAGLDPGAGYRIGVVPLLDQVAGAVRRPLLVLLASTTVLLLVACANVANLLLTRAAAREHELGVRIAQGAPASTLVLETLARCAWLSLLGATAGLLVAWLALGALARLGPTDLPRLDQVRVDGGVFLFALGLVILVTVAAGLAPALRALRVDPAQVLMRAGSRSRSGSAFRRPGAQLLLVAQVALSLVLLVASGLLLRSLLHLRATDPGFEPAGAFSFRVSLAGDRYREPTARVELFRLLWERLRALPEVAAGGGTTLLPLTRGYAWTDFVLEGQGAPDGRDRVVADVSTVSEGYFSAMGIPLLAGRRFSAADGLEPLSVIVDRTLAERHWGVDEAVGRWIDNDLIGRATVVGVVDSVLHYGLDAEPRMTVFYPYPARAARSLYGVLRTADGDSDPAALRDAVVAAVRELDPELAVHDTRTLRQRVGASLARQRLLTWLLAAFAVVALTLATIGLYGLLAYAVGTETRSIGIRRTFGAQERDLYRLVLGAAGRIVLWGLALGLAVTFLAGRAIAGLLFRVETGDLVTHVGALLLLASVAAIAALAPARRAARIEPLDALRSE